jgi:hypothetical protein
MQYSLLQERINLQCRIALCNHEVYVLAKVTSCVLVLW